MNLKCIALIFLVVLQNINSTVNGCGALGTAAPTTKEDCNKASNSTITCCYAHIVLASKTSDYCVLLWGALKTSALDDFQADIKALTGSQIICASSFTSVTIIATFLVSILILF